MGTAVPVVAHLASNRASLPVYAFYSVMRIGIAYVLSLIFAITYGYIAAYNPRVEAWMIAVLDILQSIPVLSFLPPVVLAMVALIPRHQLGIEMGVILLIFTGQVWNLAFSFYSSLKAHPARDDRSVAHLSLLRLAALLAARNALRHHRPGVELDRLGGRRLVCADGLRDVHHGHAQLPAAGLGQLYPDRHRFRRRARAGERIRNGRFSSSLRPIS